MCFKLFISYIHTCLENAFDTDKIKPKAYEMPDGSKLELKETQYLCPELLFDGTLMRSEGGSIQELVNNTIKKTDSNIIDVLAQNCILSGGSTLFKGIEERLRHELIQLNPDVGHNLSFKGNYASR